MEAIGIHLLLLTILVSQHIEQITTELAIYGDRMVVSI